MWQGLVNAVSLVWKKAEHRNCARHIFANWKKKNKGEDLKDVYWRAVRSYCVADYNEAIKEMTTLSSDAVEDFLKQNPKGFTRCFLSNQTKCDVIVSNMAETFNGYIIHEKECRGIC